jgi:hypothetical protein
MSVPKKNCTRQYLASNASFLDDPVDMNRAFPRPAVGQIMLAFLCPAHAVSSQRFTAHTHLCATTHFLLYCCSRKIHSVLFLLPWKQKQVKEPLLGSSYTECLVFKDQLQACCAVLLNTGAFVTSNHKNVLTELRKMKAFFP